MVNTNYRISALKYLFNKECMPERYYSLLEYKDDIISALKKLNIRNKNEALKLSDEQYREIGLSDNIICLFKRFLCLYDVSQNKLNETKKIKDSKIGKACEELYYLPGVKLIRGSLYYYAGYKTLLDIANTDVSTLIDKCNKAIIKKKLNCIAPLPKEARTHIAVAKTFIGK